MPLFGGNRFKLRKENPRKAKFCRRDQDPKSNGDDCFEIKVKLGGVISTFENGDWHHDIPKTKDLVQKELLDNRAEIKKLKEQIYMIRVKNEILLDTVVAQKSKMAYLESENTNLRRIFDKSQSQSRLQEAD